MRAGVVILAVGCGPGDPPPRVEHHLPTPAERAAAPKSSAEHLFEPPVPAPAPAPRRATLTAAWSDVTTVDGCFYFSGPRGRDDQLTGPVSRHRAGRSDLSSQWPSKNRPALPAIFG